VLYQALLRKRRGDVCEEGVHHSQRSLLNHGRAVELAMVAHQPDEAGLLEDGAGDHDFALRVGRILFAVSWLGATDTTHGDAPLEPSQLQEELDFLFHGTRQALGVDLTRADVRSVWVGFRPLVKSAISAQSGATS
jgi:hypothetical protein